MSSADVTAGGRVLHDLTRRECLELLSTHQVGRVAVHGGGVAPIVRPVNYVFDPSSQAVVFRTAGGSKLHSLLHETHAAFEVDGLDPETQTGWSVILVGVTEPLLRADEIRRAEALGLKSWGSDESANWIRIRAWTVSGRRVAGPLADPVHD